MISLSWTPGTGNGLANRVFGSTDTLEGGSGADMVIEVVGMGSAQAGDFIL